MAKKEKQTQKNPPMGHGPGARIVQKPKNFKKSVKMLVAFLKPNLITMIFGFLFAIAGTVLAIVCPNIIKEIGTEIFTSVQLQIPVDMTKVASTGLWLIIMYVLSMAFSYSEGFIMSGISAKVSRSFRSQISQKINRMPLKYFDNQSVGDILSRITNDVDTISQTLNQSLSNIIYCITMMVGALILMFVNSWLLTLITLAATPVSMLLVLCIVKFSQKYFKRQQRALGELNGIIEENYSAHNVVKVFNGMENAEKQFEKVNNKLFSSAFKAQFLSGIMHPAMNAINNLVYVLICVIGGIMSLDNPVFAVTIVTFITYMRMFNQQIGQVAQISGTLQSMAAASERVFEFLNEEEMPAEQKQFELPQMQGKIEFKNVNFGYDKEKTIIHNFSAVAHPGQKIAIVGPTGAGKTTLVNLLMRFYEIDDGQILIDGIDTKTMTREQCRSLFGMVLQDTWLFEGTIRENLAYGTPGKTNEEIENACCFAHIDHFIRSLPGGYDMVLDETANISQGQRQLLTIARAMVNNAPMLILDEATSSVDTRTEIMIQKAMDKLMEGRTSFVIAHRLSTIKNADLILVMKEGNIVEQGNHDELMQKQGFYAELYNSQFAEG